MVEDLISLSVIALVAFICPLVARAIPGRLVPETVFLLIAGMLLGPSMANVVHLSDSIGLLSDLGLAFLFLLAGFEIDPKSLTGRAGKRGFATWVVSFLAAILITGFFLGSSEDRLEHIALSIALTTTALGTLMPILKERELVKTRVGESILAYGTWGELCPILAMALLLSTRAEWKTVLILAAFLFLCIIAAVIPARSRKAGHKLFHFLSANADTTSQTMVRATVLLLVALVAFSAIFDLDIVLGAFAAGFVLRYIIPEGNGSLEKKLDGIAYGFLIPVFFIASGAKINIGAVFSAPGLLVAFVILLLLVRGAPIVAALSIGKSKHDLSPHNRLTVALYCTTALPLIVAVTSVAVSAGSMSQDTASVLVAAGATTVFLMPLLASITYRIADAKPIEAVREIAASPADATRIIHDHWELERMLARQEAAARRAARTSAALGKEIPWQEAAFALQRKSARKRIIDDALDAAAQDISAQSTATLDFGDVVRRNDSEKLKEARRKRIAQYAIREYNDRIRELQSISSREETRSARE